MIRSPSTAHRHNREFCNALSTDGVWLVLAKKGTSHPTSLTYAQALDEALCQGWIDGQKAAVDDTCWRQRFTATRRASSETAPTGVAPAAVRACQRAGLAAAGAQSS